MAIKEKPYVLEKDEENVLNLKSINQLLEHSFFIPSYQRGYRWTETEVTALLDDIWNFGLHRQQAEAGEPRPFYCLQPIVVKKHKRENVWEVIDGQQRLTTIFLILKSLKIYIEREQKNLKRLFYETRPESEEFLLMVDQNLIDKNIDYHYIAKAEKAILEWFRNIANNSDHPAPKSTFAPSFLTSTKVIWYEVKDGSDAIDIFTRLNIGKIPLTNAELIKALFLRQSNFKNNKEAIRLKQLQIATEWDEIESRLQDDSFWHFIYNGDNLYSTRIEYIFDLMKKKNPGDETYYTFHKFNTSFKDDDPDIEALWLEIKIFFLTFDEWYRDRELYHLIGFIIATDIPISVILELKQKSSNKTEFKKFLRDKIKNNLECNFYELDYTRDKTIIGKILLLFNIQIIISNRQSILRFPFDRYKKENWDIEHVRSQTDKPITGKARVDWAKDVLDFFNSNIGTSIKAIEPSEDKDLQKEDFLVFKLSNFINKNDPNDSAFEGLYKDIIEYFGEHNEPENINSISNLALLDAQTNRSYKNAPFPVKRKTIIQNDTSGKFVPIGTKNVFLKIYSERVYAMMNWTKEDADDYSNAIKETLKEYLPTQILN